MLIHLQQHSEAIYTSAIVRNHPFVDGNKRAAAAVTGLAAGAITEAGYAAFLAANSERAA